MEELVKTVLEGSGIAIFVYFVIRGMKKEIVTLSQTVKHQNEIFDAMSKRISETEKMAESYKKWWEELQESYDKHKVALTKAKDEYISELEKAIEHKDEKLQAKAEAELDMITMQEETIEDLKQRAFETERKLIEMRGVDQLTGIKNRMSIEKDIRQLIREQRSFSLILMGLDGLKNKNDVYGHVAGDHILIEQSKRIINLAGTDRIVGRFGGDEFIIVDKTENIAESELFVKELLKEISKLLTIEGNEITISTSIGLSHFPQHDVDLRKLLIQADVALYIAKKEGRNCYKVWDETLNIEELTKT
jgi:diguanylate cyclase (GGDEF)-like protein